MRCQYCFLDWRNDFRGKKMDWQTLENSLLLLLDDKISGDVEEVMVSLFGGEPLLELSLIKRVIEFSRSMSAKRKIIFVIVTNGLLLTPSTQSFLEEQHVLVTLSCDGTPDSHDTHRRLASGEGSSSLLIPDLERIARYPDIKVRITYTASTASKLSQNVRFLYQKGFRHIGFSNIDGMNIDSELKDIIEKQIKIISNFWLERYQEGDPFWVSPLIGFLQYFIDSTYPFHIHMHKCEVGEHEIGIDPLGNIYPCYRFTAMGQYLIGNVNKRGIDFSVLQNFIRQKRRGAEGCLAVNYRETGNIGKPHQAALILKRIYFETAKGLYLRMPSYLRDALVESKEFKMLLTGKSAGLPPIPKSQ